jgi:hypothetical protein
MRPANEFPPDDTGYGFDNIGDVLTVSPMLMEKYLRAANTVAGKALDTSTLERIDLELGAKKFWNQKGETKEWEGVRWFHSNADAATKFTAPASGTYFLKLHVSATQAGPDVAKLKLQVDGKDMGAFDITARYRGDKGPWQTIRQELQLGSGEHKIVVGFVNDFSDPQNPDPEKRDRNLVLDHLDIEGPFGLLPPRGTRLVQWLLDGKPAGLPAMKLSGEDFERGEGNSSRDTGAIVLPSNGYVKHPDRNRQGRQVSFRRQSGCPAGRQRTGEVRRALGRQKRRLLLRHGQGSGAAVVQNRGRSPVRQTRGAGLVFERLLRRKDAPGPELLAASVHHRGPARSALRNRQHGASRAR